MSVAINGDSVKAVCAPKPSLRACKETPKVRGVKNLEVCEGSDLGRSIVKSYESPTLNRFEPAFELLFPEIPEAGISGPMQPLNWNQHFPVKSPEPLPYA